MPWYWWSESGCGRRDFEDEGRVAAVGDSNVVAPLEELESNFARSNL